MKRPLRAMVLAVSMTLMWGVASVSRGEQPDVGSVVNLSEASKALQALEDFIRDYEVGNIAQIRRWLDPGMIGYQRFIDGILQDKNRQQQIRIHLLDTQTLLGPDVAVIQASWEKRYLTITPSMNPGHNSGKSQFLMHRGRDGWRIAAIGGDNPFASQAGVLAQLNLTFTASIRSMKQVNVEIVDPDLAGQGSLSSYSLSVNDAPCSVQPISESLPGKFQGSSGCTATVGDVVVLQYVDQNPGNGRPPSLLSRRVTTP